MQYSDIIWVIVNIDIFYEYARFNDIGGGINIRPGQGVIQHE
jgi:hypothetical protein